MKRLFLASVMALSVCANANALSITPATSAFLTGNQTSTSAIEDYIAPYLSPFGITMDELYKSDVPSTEGGLFASSYDTTYYNTPTDPADATITWTGTGSNYITGSFLLVKDGNQTPAWYLFDLRNSWDGMEQLTLTGFWPNQGAISHVALYGGGTGGNEVPEPATMLLFGAGLAGLAAARRRKKA